MALESAPYINSLDINNPTATDPKNQGDDHLRLIKSAIKASFPNVAGAATPTHTELNYVTGVTSAIQTQINAKGDVTLAGSQSLTNKTMGAGCVWNGGTVSVAYGGTGVATLTGIVKGNGTGAFSAAAAGTDYLAPSGALGTPSSGNLSSCTADGTNAVGFKNIPQNSQSTAYTLVLADAGKHILHPSADTTARTFTIPANASVAYPIGTALTFINQNAAGVVTIAINTDTMRLAVTGAIGSRTLAANGVATAIKLTATEWIISGSGLS